MFVACWNIVSVSIEQNVPIPFEIPEEENVRVCCLLLDEKIQLFFTIENTMHRSVYHQRIKLSERLIMKYIDECRLNELILCETGY